MKPRKHLVIPDTQVRPGVKTDHLRHIGNYIAEKKPDVVVHLGDHADMVSLNSYQLGKASAEGTRYERDIDCAKQSMKLLTEPFRSIKGYKPKMVLTLGNHEARITREAESNPKLQGLISVNDLEYERFGWKVYPFLEVAKIDNVEYAHYFTSGVLGRPVSSAAALLRQRHCSAVQGHVQLLDIAIHPKTQHVAVFAGIAYQHNEDYLGPQGNNTKRGIWLLNEVVGGTFSPMFVSLGFLKREYS